MLLILILVVILSGCSSDSKFEKLLNASNKAIDQWNMDKAVDIYKEILSIDKNSLDKAKAKVTLIEESLPVLEEIHRRKDLLYQGYMDTIGNKDNFILEGQEVSAIKDVYGKLKDLETLFSYFPNTKIASEIRTYSENIEKSMQEHIPRKLLDSIDQNLSNNEIEQAIKNINQINEIVSMFPDIKMREDIEVYRKKIKDEEKKYIIFPMEVVDRNEVLYEGKGGKITLVGEAIKDNALYAVYKFEGALKEAASKVDIKTNVLLSDGKYINNTSREYIYTDDYTLALELLSHDMNNLIKEYSYIIPLESEETKKISLEAKDIKKIIPPIKKILDTEFKTQIVLEDEIKKVEIKNVKIADRADYTKGTNVTIEGVITFKEDKRSYEYDSVCYLINPSIMYSQNGSFTQFMTKDFTKDFPQNFDINFQMPYISEDTSYLTLYFMDLRTNINLEDGQMLILDQESLVNTVMNRTGFTQMHIQLENDKGLYLRDTSGDISLNTIAFDGGYDLFASPRSSISINLGKMYNRLKVEIGVDKTTAGKEYGNSTVELVGDGKVIKTIEIPTDPKTEQIEISISGIKLLEIRADQNFGPKYGQRILLKNGILVK